MLRVLYVHRKRRKTKKATKILFEIFPTKKYVIEFNLHNGCNYQRVKKIKPVPLALIEKRISFVFLVTFLSFFNDFSTLIRLRKTPRVTLYLII